MLDTMESWIDQIPPIDQPQRFGNKAFRTWCSKLEEVRGHCNFWVTFNLLALGQSSGLKLKECLEKSPSDLCIDIFLVDILSLIFGLKALFKNYISYYNLKLLLQCHQFSLNNVLCNFFKSEVMLQADFFLSTTDWANVTY